jgi:hypothetical protein
MRKLSSSSGKALLFDVLVTSSLKPCTTVFWAKFSATFWPFVLSARGSSLHCKILTLLITAISAVYLLVQSTPD